MHGRTLMRLLLLFEVTAALLVAWLLARLAHWPAWLALAAAAVLTVLVRLAINLNNFSMAARAGGGVPDAFRLDRGSRLRMLAGEFRASMAVSHWHMLHPPVPARIYPESTRVPVLLVHGYGASGGYWAHLAPLLDAARISHARVDLAPVGGDIDDYVPAVQQAVEALCAATGAARVAIVGHSMGGLVGRAWMRRHGTARLARLITIGTPHHGTVLASLGPGVNAVQMRREGEHGNDWLRALAAGESAADRALITSIWSHHDNIVAPQDSGRLPGARNIEVGGIGHVALGRHPRVLAEVMRELDMLAPEHTRITPRTS